jgi:hypothetical protein
VSVRLLEAGEGEHILADVDLASIVVDLLIAVAALLTSAQFGLSVT